MGRLFGLFFGNSHAPKVAVVPDTKDSPQNDMGKHSASNYAHMVRDPREDGPEDLQL